VSAVVPAGSMAELTAFHAANKLLLLAHSEMEMRRLGRLLANASGLDIEDVAVLYGHGFAAALAEPASRGGVVNALLHGFGVVSDGLEPAERQAFLAQVEAYAEGRSGSTAARAQLRTWAEGQDADWLAAQTLLDPAAELP
jgi:uncharacterized protein YbgA (DUF1722 family)